MMIEHVLDAVAAVCERIVIVGAHSLGLDREYLTIMDARPGIGPLSGIDALLASGADETGQYLVCPCDVPLITPHLLRLLLRPTDALATVFRVEGNNHFEPLPLRISAASAPIAAKLLDERDPAVWRLLQQLQPDIIEINSTDAFLLHNVNTRADYESLISSDSFARAKNPPQGIPRESDR
jgi:molybdopterin-guanine dinucleotide biosynthesis protein A